MLVRGFVGSSFHLFITGMKILFGCCYSLICRNLKYRMVASKCISHFLQFILLLLELFLAMKFRVSLHTKHCKIQAYNMHKFRLYRYLGHGRFVGGGGVGGV